MAPDPRIKPAVDLDPWLEPFSGDLLHRQTKADSLLRNITQSEDLISFALLYRSYGAHVDTDNTIVVREYIPNVQEVSLVGDFNNWNPQSHKFHRKNEFGLWELRIPPVNGHCAIENDLKMKLAMLLPLGERIFRLSPWLTRATAPEIQLDGSVLSHI